MTRRPAGLDPVPYGVLFAVVAALSLAPIALVDLPPLHDYPFHLARFDILARLDTSQFLQRHYRYGSLVLPNVGIDLLAWGLAELVPLKLAGLISLGAIQLAVLSGVAGLHYALHRRLSAWPLIAGVLLYNWIFLYGFLNYLFGLGLWFWAVALWLLVRDRAVRVRLVAGTLAAVVLFFCHLVALGLFAIVVAGIELRHATATLRAAPGATLGRLAIGALPFLVPLGLLLGVSPTATTTGMKFEYAWWGWKPMVTYQTLMSSNDLADGLLAVAAGCLVVLVIWQRRSVTWAGTMTLPLVLLGLAFLALPVTLMSSTFGDARLPLAIVFLAIAASDLRPPTARLGRVLVAALIGLIVVRTGLIAADWRRYDRVFASFEAAFDRLEPGSVLLAATAGNTTRLIMKDPADIRYWRPPLKHVVSLASHGRDVFVPATFAHAYQQPIQVRAPFAALYEFHDVRPYIVKTPDALADFVRAAARLVPAEADGRRPPIYVLLTYPNDLRDAAVPGLTKTADGPYFALYRLTGEAG